MDFSNSTPEYRELLKSANVSPCICKNKLLSLIEAAENGCLKCCAKFIGQAGRFVRDWSALMKAACRGCIAVARLLIPLEARMQDEDGWTALMWASMHGQREAVELLAPYEAGMTENESRTAAVIAAESYQLECLHPLLENKAEREASQVPEVMLAAYRGDIRDLLTRRDEWLDKYVGVTALDFALAGRQGRAYRLLTHTSELRRCFARHLSAKAGEDVYKVARYISPEGHLTRSFLSVACSAEASQGPELLLLSLAEQSHITRRMRPLCTQQAGALARHFCWCDDEAQLVRVFSGLKHAGFSVDGEALLNLPVKHSRTVREKFQRNPLKMKQIERGWKEAKGKPQNNRQAAWREIEAESRFNRDLLSEASRLALGAFQAARFVCDRNAGQIRRKQIVGRVLLMDFVHGLQKVVQEMLDE